MGHGAAVGRIAAAESQLGSSGRRPSLIYSDLRRVCVCTHTDTDTRTHSHTMAGQFTLSDCPARPTSFCGSRVPLCVCVCVCLRILSFSFDERRADGFPSNQSARSPIKLGESLLGHVKVTETR